MARSDRPTVDYAATLLRLAHCPGDYGYDARRAILIEAAEHITALRRELAESAALLERMGLLPPH